MNPINFITDYVEGRISLDAFYDAACKQQELEDLLQEDVDIKPYTNDGTLFHYLIGQDPSSLAADVNVRDAMAQLLGQKGVSHVVDESAGEVFDVILDATPAWLSLTNGYADQLKAGFDESRGRKVNQSAIRKKILEDFRYLNKPPKWLQSPDWMMNGNHPLLFVGQLDVSDVMHDTTYVYVFMDQDNGSFHTRKQAL